MIPLYGFLRGDTMGVVVLAHPEDSVASLAAALQRAARSRVRLHGTPRVVHDGRILDPSHTIEQSGMGPLARFDVIQEGD